MLRACSDKNNTLTRTNDALSGKDDTLVELGRVKDELASMTVHDLRNPLSVIVANYDYLLEGFEGSVDCLEALHACQTAGRRMPRLLANLVDVARLEGGTLNVRASEINLMELLESVAEQRRVLAESRGSPSQSKHSQESTPFALPYHCPILVQMGQSGAGGRVTAAID